MNWTEIYFYRKEHSGYKKWNSSENKRFLREKDFKAYESFDAFKIIWGCQSENISECKISSLMRKWEENKTKWIKDKENSVQIGNHLADEKTLVSDHNSLVYI